MAPARRARSPASDIDPESKQDTPKPQKNGLKKRVSEIFTPDNDHSFTDSTGGARPPLRAVNINDDAAEKRRRRKSTKLAVVESVNSLVGPSSEGMQQDRPQPDGNGENSRIATKQKPLKTVAAPVINVSMDVMSSNFEEWMKMATDNKINAQNSWNFALIDYFHDMSLLRNKDDNSINFQRASFTLDGCVKIWTSRVDSVGTETGKLLGNLESGGRVVDEDDAESDNPDADPTETSKKRKKAGSGNTLVKDPSQLKNKKLDLEFAVDPLFKKTCADFDEGGASGLLMNHLSLGIGSEGCMRVVFDASDPMGQLEDEEPIQEPEDYLDLSFLRAKFFPDLSVLEDKEISHSLVNFSFGKETFNLETAHDSMYADNTRPYDDNDCVSDDDNDMFRMDLGAPDGNAPPVEDFFVGADAVNDDFGGDMMGADDFGGDNDTSQNGSAGPPGELEDGRPGPFVPFDPRRLTNSNGLTLAMADPDAEGALDYFDDAFLKNWAGPEHWKVRRPIRKAVEITGGAEGSRPNKRAKKDPVKIDFTTPLEKDVKEHIKDLFAPVTGKNASIDLPGTKTLTSRNSKKKEKEKDDHRLPDDMHFSSKQLVTLFLKPKFFLRMRGRRVKMNENGDGEVDEQFWAQAAADQAANRNIDDDGDDGNEQAPFSTQFFNDDDFGGGFDDDGGYDGEGGPSGADANIDEGEQDLLAATQGQTRRVKPEFVKYTKRAKRVDVRKLKDNIWKGLDIVIEKNEEKEKSPDGSMDVDERPPTDPTEARQFNQVISGLQKTYPKDKMEEISTSFCFICLLHLANEQGLKLESAVESLNGKEPGLVEDDEGEAPASEKKIGDIWDIKIYRDPDATQSA